MEIKNGYDTNQLTNVVDEKVDFAQNSWYPKRLTKIIGTLFELRVLVICESAFETYTFMVQWCTNTLNCPATFGAFRRQVKRDVT